MIQYVSHPFKTLFNVDMLRHDVCLNCIQYLTTDKQAYDNKSTTYSSDQSLVSRAIKQI